MSFKSNQATLPFKITLDYSKQPELFNDIAHKVADLINKSVPETKTTQMRKFYDYVLVLLDKASDDEQTFRTEILPFVKMLNSKVAYSNSRKHVSNEFADIIKQCIEQIQNKKDLQTFKYFFEAVLGFSKK